MNEFGESTVSGGMDIEKIDYNKVGGALNKLDMITYKGGGKAFFKEEKPVDNEYEKQHPGVDTGTQEFNPRFGARSVAMARLDGLLNANILVKTEFATQVRPDASGTMKAKMGIVMEKARGQGVTENLESGLATNIQDAVLMRGMSKLQLIDALCGQADRHQGNYYIERNDRGEVIGVKGIDNDLSFGTLITDPTDKGSKTFKGQYRGIPPLIDEQLGNALLQISASTVQEALNGLLTSEEIGATLSRLANLKTELQKMKANGLFRAATQWGAGEYQKMNHWDSYYGQLTGSSADDLGKMCKQAMLDKGIPANDPRVHDRVKDSVGKLLYNLIAEQKKLKRAQASEAAEKAAVAVVNNAHLDFIPTLKRFLSRDFHLDFSVD